MSDPAEPGAMTPLCSHRCILHNGHDGLHQYGYNLPSDDTRVAELEAERDAAVKATKGAASAAKLARTTADESHKIEAAHLWAETQRLRNRIAELVAEITRLRAIPDLVRSEYRQVPESSLKDGLDVGVRAVEIHMTEGDNR